MMHYLHAEWRLIGLIVIAAVLSGCATTAPSTPQPPERIYRIQLVQTSDKSAAEATVNRALSWWRELDAAERPVPLREQGFQPDIVWQQPYYRVRVGAFETRAAAREVVPVLRQRFPDAFVAPVTRRPARQ